MKKEKKKNKCYKESFFLVTRISVEYKKKKKKKSVDDRIKTKTKKGKLIDKKGTYKVKLSSRYLLAIKTKALVSGR